MKRILIVAVIAAGSFLLIAQPKPPVLGNKVVVVELFTSQG
jgi:hypothetical protein